MTSEFVEYLCLANPMYLSLMSKPTYLLPPREHLDHHAGPQPTSAIFRPGFIRQKIFHYLSLGTGGPNERLEQAIRLRFGQDGFQTGIVLQAVSPFSSPSGLPRRLGPQAR